MMKIADYLVDKISPSRLDPIGLGQAYWNFWRGIMKDPGALMTQNIQLAADQVKLLTYSMKKATGQEEMNNGSVTHTHLHRDMCCYFQGI